MGRFNRSDFLDEVIVNNVAEKDLVMTNFDKFQLKRPTTFYQIQYDDIKRPDLLSLRLYGKIDYWWIIGKVNAINDFFNDISVGDVIIVPDVSDIEDFYLTIKVQ